MLAWLDYKHINMSVVKRHNGTSHLRNQRKVRNTLVFFNDRTHNRRCIEAVHPKKGKPAVMLGRKASGPDPGQDSGVAQ